MFCGTRTAGRPHDKAHKPSIEAHGGIAELKRAAKVGGIHLVEVADDKGRVPDCHIAELALILRLRLHLWRGGGVTVGGRAGAEACCSRGTAMPMRLAHCLVCACCLLAACAPIRLKPPESIFDSVLVRADGGDPAPVPPEITTADGKLVPSVSYSMIADIRKILIPLVVSAKSVADIKYSALVAPPTIQASVTAPPWATAVGQPQNPGVHFNVGVR